MVQYNAEYTGTIDPEKKYFPEVAGAESNVAINLSKITKNHAEILWVSRLGRDEAGRLIRKIISQHIPLSIMPFHIMNKFMPFRILNGLKKMKKSLSI